MPEKCQIAKNQNLVPHHSQNMTQQTNQTMSYHPNQYMQQHIKQNIVGHPRKVPKTSNKKWLQKPESDKDTSESDTDNEDDATTANITVQMSAPTGKRNYVKHQYCCFCENDYTRLDKHLVRAHQSAEEVVEMMKYSKKSKERTMILQDLTRLGNYNHNISVLQKKQGEIVVVRRPRKGANTHYSRFVPCHTCLGFFHKDDLWRHTCPSPNSSGPALDSRTALRKGRALLYSTMHNKPSPVLSDILAKMRRKDLAEVIAGDHLICKYGHWMLMKHATNIDQSKYISNKLRELARLVVAARDDQKTEELDLTQIMSPGFFDRLVEIVKKMPKDGPSFEKRIGESLQKVVVVLKGHFMSEADSKGRKSADHFEWQITKMWPDLVTIPALRELNFKKQAKPASIPFSEDVQKFADMVKKKIDEVHTATAEGNKAGLRYLLELCLARIITFNKRRSGEVAKLPLEFYLMNVERANSPEVIQDLEQSLDPIERQLCNKMFLVRGRGKRGR